MIQQSEIIELEPAEWQYTRLGIWHPIIWSVISSKGAEKLTQELLEKVYLAVSHKHPMLSTKVEERRGIRTLAKSNTATWTNLPVKIIAGMFSTRDELFTKFVSLMRTKKGDSESDWQSEFVWSINFYTLDQQPNIIGMISRFNHSVCDGLSIMKCIRDVVKCLNIASYTRNLPEINCLGETLPFPGPMSLRVPEPPPSQQQQERIPKQRTKEEWESLWKSAENGILNNAQRLHCLSEGIVFTEKETMEVVGKLKEHSCSMTSFILSASALCSNCSRFATAIPVSTRNEERSEEISFCVGALPIYIETIDPHNLWETCKQFQNQIKEGIKHGNHLISDINGEGTAGMLEVFAKDLGGMIDTMGISEEMHDTCGTIVSNMGIVDGKITDYAIIGNEGNVTGWNVEEWMGSGGNNFAQGTTCIWCQTFKGKFSLAVLGYSPPQRPEVFKSFCSSLIDIIRNISKY